jgi:hypothetical protein
MLEKLVGDGWFEETVLDEAVVASASEDNVVEESDAEDFGGCTETVGDLAVLRRWI